MDHWLILLLALGLDALVGDPDWLWRRVPHPVVLFGGMIERLDRRWNTNTAPKVLERRGLVVIASLLAFVVGMGAVLTIALDSVGWVGGVLEAIVAAVLLAQRSLAEHVARVAEALELEGLHAGRKAVSMIVGRDVSQLDEGGVSRAAIESLAENFSDGVIAPVFWYALLGLPGLFAYKLVNTADSMIGHMNERYRYFGRASARIDDAMNWVPARLSALFIALAQPGSFARTMHIVRCDAPRHRSPNAGWPEAAMAAVSGTALGGPRAYGVRTLSEPIFNAAGCRSLTAKDIRACLRVFWSACAIQAFLVAFLSVL